MHLKLLTRSAGCSDMVFMADIDISFVGKLFLAISSSGRDTNEGLKRIKESMAAYGSKT